MKKILIAILCSVIVVAGIVTMNIAKNTEKRLKSDSMLAQLKHGMALGEIVDIFGRPESVASGRVIYQIRLPDGRVALLVDYCKEVYLEETKGELAGFCFEYDLDKQELIKPFMPDSLMGIQYGMTVKKIEKIFIGDSQQNISYYGGRRSSQIALNSASYEYAEPRMYIDVNLIRLSTGEWVNLGFESLHNEPNVLLYVYMKAADRKWYVYDLNTQELTKERAPKDKIWEGYK
ncbi:MAG: hypothetical protein FWG43_02535 [Clostridiales bacterium]|nr:hypothetical protein [Clostridiales bacterium]